MTLHAIFLALLLTLPTLAQATNPVTFPASCPVPCACQDIGSGQRQCTYFGTAAPESNITAANINDIYVQLVPRPNPNRIFDFTGTAGTNVGWVARPGVGPFCGDGIVNQAAEQCDAPGGVGQIGTCALITDCQSTCLCSPASPCGDGVYDPMTEQCDESDDNTVCRGRCTSTCKCNCVCGDTIVNGACVSGIGETCDAPDSSGGSGVDFGNAVLFQRLGCSATNNGCATIRDSTGNRNGTGTSWDYLGALAFTCMARVNFTVAPTAAQRVVYNGGNNDTTSGWLGELAISGGNVRVGAEFSPDTTANANQTVLLGTTNLSPNTNYTFFWGQNAAGTTGNLYLANPATGVVGTEATSAITLSTVASSQRFTVGGNQTSSSALDNVRVDEVACFDIELSSAEMNALVAARVPTTHTGLSLLLDFDEALGSTSLTNKASAGIAATFQLCNGADAADNAPCDPGTGCTTNCTGTVALFTPSPWTTTTGGGAPSGVVPDNCSVACGCTSTQVCNKTSCVCQSAGTSPNIRYIATTGNDTNPCTTGSPCRTPQWVMCGNSGCNNPNRLAAGDKLLFKDGTYSPFTISGGVNINDGTANSPITIGCENERKCRLDSTGTTPALTVENTKWIVVDGFDFRTVDNANAMTATNPTFFDNQNQDLKVRRTTTNKNQRCGNNSNYKSVSSQRTLYEENEAWNHSRHAYSCTGSTGIIWRRNYANNNGVTQSTDPACVPGAVPGGTSRESFAIYPCTESLLENNIVEGSQAWGFNVEATDDDFNGARTANVRIIGNIAANTTIGMKIFTRDGAFRGLFNTLVRDFLAINTTTSFGIRDSVSVQSLYDNIAVYNSAASGAPAMQVDDPCSTPPCTAQLACSELTPAGTEASATITDFLFCGNAGPGLNVVACNGSATRRCTLTNGRSNNTGTNYQNLASTCLGSGGDQCACTSTATTACTGFGTTGTDCVTRPISGLGPDLRCMTVGGITGTGSANNLWWQSGDTTPGGTATAVDATCAAAPGAGPTLGCVGGFKFCGATIAGVNDEADCCRTFSQRWLNHQPDNGGCPAATFACP